MYSFHVNVSNFALKSRLKAIWKEVFLKQVSNEYQK